MSRGERGVCFAQLLGKPTVNNRSVIFRMELSIENKEGRNGALRLPMNFPASDRIMGNVVSPASGGQYCLNIYVGQSLNLKFEQTKTPFENQSSILTQHKCELVFKWPIFMKNHDIMIIDESDIHNG